MKENLDKSKDWKAVLMECLRELGKKGIVQDDVWTMTGKLVLEINLNQGGITDLDVSVRRKYK
jgi:hypothetical protein